MEITSASVWHLDLNIALHVKEDENEAFFFQLKIKSTMITINRSQQELQNAAMTYSLLAKEDLFI